MLSWLDFGKGNKRISCGHVQPSLAFTHGADHRYYFFHFSIVKNEFLHPNTAQFLCEGIISLQSSLLYQNDQIDGSKCFDSGSKRQKRWKRSNNSVTSWWFIPPDGQLQVVGVSETTLRTFRVFPRFERLLELVVQILYILQISNWFNTAKISGILNVRVNLSFVIVRKLDIISAAILQQKLYRMFQPVLILTPMCPSIPHLLWTITSYNNAKP